MKAFWCNILKGKCCEINSNQKLIKVDAIGTVKECLITFIEPRKHGCQRKNTCGIKFKQLHKKAKIRLQWKIIYK